MHQSIAKVPASSSQPAYVSTQPPRSLFTLRAFADRHRSFLTLSALTNQVQKAKPRYSTLGLIKGNGLESAIVRIGGRVLIDEAAYFQWVEAQQERK
jgi:hypothetical protein